MREELLEQAKDIFKDTGLNITTAGQKYLGSPIGVSSFKEAQMMKTVNGWVKEVTKLSLVAASQPQAAYSAFTHGLSSKWMYLMRTTEGIDELLQPLEDAIRHKFLPALTGRSVLSDIERRVMALPVRMGGMGIITPTSEAKKQFENSKQISQPLVNEILKQTSSYNDEIEQKQRQEKSRVKQKRRKMHMNELDDIYLHSNATLKKATELAQEKGASIWLCSLPLNEHGFSLHKGAFRDALALRYGWQLSNLPKECVCGKAFTVEHAFSCSTGFSRIEAQRDTGCDSKVNERGLFES